MRTARYHVHRHRIVAEEADDVVTVLLHLDASPDETPCRQTDTTLRIQRVRRRRVLFGRRCLVIVIIVQENVQLLVFSRATLCCIARYLLSSRVGPSQVGSSTKTATRRLLRSRRQRCTIAHGLRSSTKQKLSTKSRWDLPQRGRQMKVG